MTALRRIQSWVHLLHRPATRGCPRAAAPASRKTAACPPQVRRLTVSARCGLRNADKDFGGGRGAGVTEEEEEEDFMDDSEVEELFLRQVPAGVGEGQQRVFIVHPDVKWGSRKQHLTTGNKYIYSSTFTLLTFNLILLHFTQLH